MYIHTLAIPRTIQSGSRAGTAITLLYADLAGTIVQYPVGLLNWRSPDLMPTLRRQTLRGERRWPKEGSGQLGEGCARRKSRGKAIYKVVDRFLFLSYILVRI